MQLDFVLPSSRLSCLRRGTVMVCDAPAIFRVEGPGALDCLQGLLTSDLVSAGDGSLSFGALLTPKGMIVSDLWVASVGGQFTLLTGAQAHGLVADQLARTLPPRLARVTDLTGRRRAAWLLGASAPERLARAAGRPAPGPGRAIAGPTEEAPLVASGTAAAPFTILMVGAEAEVDASLLQLKHVGGHPGTEADLAATRVLGGWPTLGREIDEKTLPQEVRFDEIGGVSYIKGCYTGQETVARVHFRGHVNRSLRGLVFEGREAPAAGERRLLAEGKEVGTVRTTLALDDRVLALATVRREVPDGVSVSAGGRTGRVVSLPFDAAETAS